MKTLYIYPYGNLKRVKKKYRTFVLSYILLFFLIPFFVESKTVKHEMFPVPG